MDEKELQRKIESHEKLIAQLWLWTGRADAKASVVIYISMALLGVLSGRLPTEFKQWSIFHLVSVLAAAYFLIASLYYIYLANYPRIKPSEWKKRSVIFFGSIAHIPLQEYFELNRNLSFEDYLEDLMAACHTASQILDMKFRSLRSSYQMLLYGAISWFIAIALIQLYSGQLNH